MLRSLFSSVAGLRAHQTMMDITANNIANINTVGFKGSRATFAETLAQTIRGGGLSSPAIGGTNPMQIGLGVRVSGTDADLTQGAFQATGRSADLAIEGGGFFLVEKGSAKLLTRAGSFGWDSTGTLVTGDGARVLGWTPNGPGAIQPTGAPGRISIPTATLPPIATQNVTVGGNLTSSQPLYDASAIDPVLSKVQATLTTTATVFDSLGTAHQVSVSFTHMPGTPADPAAVPPVPAGAPTWDMSTSYVDGAGATQTVALGPVTFDAAGNLTSASPQTMGPLVFGSGNTQSVAFALGDPMHAFSQFDRASTLDAPTHDGSSGAELVDVTFTTDGAISGRYANGETRTLAILSLANVTNPAGLTRVGDNLFAMSPASGEISTGQAGTGQLGSLSPGSLEGSNVDLAAEFTNLVIAQRGFQANSRVITTSDEMLADLVNLKR
jgi:flagellar hook protein FlgE